MSMKLVPFVVFLLGVLAVGVWTGKVGAPAVDDLERDVVYTVEQRDWLDGKPVAVVSTTTEEGEKVELRTMEWSVVRLPMGTRFVFPSDGPPVPSLVYGHK